MIESNHVTIDPLVMYCMLIYIVIMITRKNTIINAESERKLDNKLIHYQSTMYL